MAIAYEPQTALDPPLMSGPTVRARPDSAHCHYRTIDLCRFPHRNDFGKNSITRCGFPLLGEAADARDPGQKLASVGLRSRAPPSQQPGAQPMPLPASTHGRASSQSRLCK